MVSILSVIIGFIILNCLWLCSLFNYPSYEVELIPKFIFSTSNIDSKEIIESTFLRTLLINFKDYFKQEDSFSDIINNNMNKDNSDFNSNEYCRYDSVYPILNKEKEIDYNSKNNFTEDEYHNDGDKLNEYEFSNHIDMTANFSKVSSYMKNSILHVVTVSSFPSSTAYENNYETSFGKFELYTVNINQMLENKDKKSILKCWEMNFPGSIIGVVSSNNKEQVAIYYKINKGSEIIYRLRFINDFSCDNKMIISQEKKLFKESDIVKNRNMASKDTDKKNNDNNLMNNSNNKTDLVNYTNNTERIDINDNSNSYFNNTILKVSIVQDNVEDITNTDNKINVHNNNNENENYHHDINKKEGYFTINKSTDYIKHDDSPEKFTELKQNYYDYKTFDDFMLPGNSLINSIAIKKDFIAYARNKDFKQFYVLQRVIKSQDSDDNEYSSDWKIVLNGDSVDRKLKGSYYTTQLKFLQEDYHDLSLLQMYTYIKIPDLFFEAKIHRLNFTTTQSSAISKDDKLNNGNKDKEQDILITNNNNLKSKTIIRLSLDDEDDDSNEEALSSHESNRESDINLNTLTIDQIVSRIKDLIKPNQTSNNSENKFLILSRQLLILEKSLLTNKGEYNFYTLGNQDSLTNSKLKKFGKIDKISNDKNNKIIILKKENSNNLLYIGRKPFITNSEVNDYLQILNINLRFLPLKLKTKEFLSITVDSVNKKELVFIVSGNGEITIMDITNSLVSNGEKRWRIIAFLSEIDFSLIIIVVGYAFLIPYIIKIFMYRSNDEFSQQLDRRNAELMAEINRSEGRMTDNGMRNIQNMIINDNEDGVGNRNDSNTNTNNDNFYSNDNNFQSSTINSEVESNNRTVTTNTINTTATRLITNAQNISENSINNTNINSINNNTNINNNFDEDDIIIEDYLNESNNNNENVDNSNINNNNSN